MKTIGALGSVAVTVMIGAACAGGSQLPACDTDNAGLTLPDGFCALVYADVRVSDSIAQVRHLAVDAGGAVFAALNSGGFIVLSDTDGDGRADAQQQHPGDPATGIQLHDGYVYVAPDDSIVRYPWSSGSLEPSGPPEAVARDLFRQGRWHSAKGFAIGLDGSLYVNIGAPSNVCMEQPRGPGQPGIDPCPLLENSGGVWRFEANTTGQTQEADGVRFATGLRNTFALAVHPQTGALYGAQHGRDALSGLWPDLFTEEQSAETPAEEFVRIEQGDNFGWPYCYYDNQLGRLVLAPEYGGDGERPGRCAEMKGPEVGFPGHWAPEAIAFYTADLFPETYRGGAFVSFHGSWNRAPQPQAGYNVAFVPFNPETNQPAGEYGVFADGFAGAEKTPQDANHRPTGLAVGPDGSLYIGDDQAGRIYRVIYQQ
jgi:glucose/arabinose dehydrogenase